MVSAFKMLMSFWRHRGPRPEIINRAEQTACWNPRFAWNVWLLLPYF